MTKGELTKKEEEQIPVYLSAPFIEDNICYANWNDQLVWSELGASPWYLIKITKKSKIKTSKNDFQDISTSQAFKLTKKPSLRSIKEHTFAGHSSANSGDTEITN